MKDTVNQMYNIGIIDRSCDGVLGAKFTHKQSDYNFVVFACYLSPERSTWGWDTQSFFVHILAQI